MTARPWWGRARDDAPGAPLHWMQETSGDVLRSSACADAAGTGQVKAASPWTGEERCAECLRLVRAVD